MNTSVDMALDKSKDLEREIVSSGSSEEYKQSSALLSADEFDPLRTVSGMDYIWNQIDNFLQPINTQDIRDFHAIPPSNVNWDMDLELPPLDSGENDAAIDNPRVGVNGYGYDNVDAQLNSNTYTERLVASLLVEVPNAPGESNDKKKNNGKSIGPQWKEEGQKARAVRKPELVEKRVIEELLDHGILNKEDTIPTRLETKIRISQAQLRAAKDKNTAMLQKLSENAAQGVASQSTQREKQLDRDIAEMTYLNKNIRQCRKSKKKKPLCSRLEKIKGRKFEHYARRTPKGKKPHAAEDDCEEENIEADDDAHEIGSATRAGPSKDARGTRHVCL